MSRPLPLRVRSTLAVAVLALVPLAGCSTGEAGETGEASEAGQAESASSGEETRRVSAVGISFEVPERWEELDAEEVADGAGDNPQMAKVAEGMGVTADQLEQAVSMMDLFLVSDEGARDGFLDNLNVLRVPGQMPNDSQVKLSFLQLGADVERITHERTELGDTIDVTYVFEVGDARVQGEALFVEVDGKPVSVTVSAGERDTTSEIADRVRDTLAEAA